MPQPDEFEPTQALDGWRAPAPAPLQELELRSLLKVGGAGLDEAKRARMKARGYELDDVEDIELREALPLPAVVIDAPKLDLPAGVDVEIKLQ